MNQLKSDFAQLAKDARSLQPKKLITPVLVLLALGYVYGIVLNLVAQPTVNSLQGLKQEYLLLGILVLFTLLVWKFMVIKKYLAWRLERQVQSETLQYLVWAAIISAGYFWTRKVDLITDQHIVIASYTILGFLLIVALYVVSAYLKQSPANQAASTDADLVFDDIPYEGEPLPSQRVTVLELAGLLDKARDSKHPTSISAIALDGIWGDGKSSILNMAYKRIKPDKYVRVNFEPWRYTSQESLVAGFYDEIGKAVERELPGFKTARLDMAKFSQSFIAEVDKSGITKALSGAYKARPVEYAEKINRHLARHRKNLLVIIDDLDRIPEDAHIMRTLQLTQYLKTDIKNSVMLFLADLQKVEKAIPNRLRHQYTQKFFDMTITVIPPQKDEILAFLNEQLSRVELSYEVEVELNDEFYSLMRNLRGAKRILRMVISDINNIGDNVNSEDILFLRSLYYTYPAVYSSIREHEDMYFEYSYKYRFQTYGLDEEEFEKSRKTYFEQLFAGLNLPENSERTLKSLMEDHFPTLSVPFKGHKNSGDRMYYDDRRIASRSHLARYFLFNDQLDNVHERENAAKTFIFDTYLAAPEEERTGILMARIETLELNDRDTEFASLLDAARRHSEQIAGNQSDLYRDMLRAYLKLTGNVVSDDNSTLLSILEPINRYISSDTYDAILGDIDQFITHPSGGLRLLLYINPRRSNSLNMLRTYSNYAALRERILELVDRYYIDEKHDMFQEDVSGGNEWRFLLYQWSVSVFNDVHAELDEDRLNKVRRYVMDHIQGNPALLHDFVMATFWQRNMNTGQMQFMFSSQPQPHTEEELATTIRQTLDQNSGLSDEQTGNLQAFLTALEAHQVQNTPTTGQDA